MKSIKTIFILLFSFAIIFEGLNYAQIKIPLEDIPADLPSDIRIKIEKLYSQDPMERGNAAKELATMEEIASPAVPFLIDMLGDTHHILWRQDNRVVSSSSVDKEALKALISIGKPAAEPLIKALKDKNPDIRKNAVEALGEIKDTQAVVPLITALKDEDTFVRKNAAEALGKIKDSRAVGPLITALKDKKTTVQSTAYDALKKIMNEMRRDRYGIESLFALIKHEDVAVRQMAIDAIKEAQDSRAVEYLILALKDEDSYVRKNAAEALRKIGKPAVEPLITALKDEDISVRITVAMILGDIKDTRAVEPLINALKYTPPLSPLSAEKLRFESAKALGKIKDTRAIKPLIEALKDSEVRVLDCAAEALREIGKPAVEPLIATLKDENVSAKINAAMILGDLKDPRAVEPLISVLLIEAYENKSWMFRAEATRALGKIKDPRAIEPLKIMLNDHVSYIRDIADWALYQITGQSPDDK